MRIDETCCALTVTQNDFERLRIRDQARIALHYARDNFERVQVRNHAKAIQEAAVLNRRDIQFEASVLVQKAERAIAKANPANPGGKGTPKGNCVIRDNAVSVSGGVIRQIRQAHDSVDDEEFQEAVEQAKEDMQPLTRKTLVDIGKRKRREEARKGSVDRKIISYTGDNE